MHKVCEPEGDCKLRTALLNALDVVPAEDRMGLALAMCVRTLELLGHNARTSAVKQIALTNAEVARDYIPEGIAKSFVKRAYEAE